jgi:hypothetical protein
MQTQFFPNQFATIKVETAKGPREYGALIKLVKGSMIDIDLDGAETDDALVFQNSSVQIVSTDANGLRSTPGWVVRITAFTPRVALRVRVHADAVATVQRREYFRLRTKDPISILPHDFEKDGWEENWLEVHSLDISGKGIAFKSQQAFSPGTKMDLRIFLANRLEPLLLEAEVVSVARMKGYSNAYRIGAQFRRVMEEERRELLGYLKSLETGKCG